MKPVSFLCRMHVFHPINTTNLLTCHNTVMALVRSTLHPEVQEVKMSRHVRKEKTSSVSAKRSSE